MPSLAGGGAERVMLTLTNYFAERGHLVDLVLSYRTGEYEKAVHPAVAVFSLNTPRRVLATPRLARYLRTRRPEALLTTIYSLPAVLAKRVARVPTRIIIREANTPTQVLQSPLMSRKAAFTTRWGIRLLYPHADAIVAVSKGVASDIARLTHVPPQKLHIIYNPVISDAMLQQSYEPLAHPWFQPNQPPVVLAVGRLTYQKGFDTLLRAFAQVVQQLEARLVILGEGEEHNRLQQLAEQLGIASFVDLPGFDLNPFRYMRRAGVFVLASRYEGLPNVLIQALACGCAVVSTDCPSGPREILDGGRYGALVAVDDVVGLAVAIGRVLQGERPQVPAEWLEQFRVEHVAEQYLQVMLGTS